MKVYIRLLWMIVGSIIVGIGLNLAFLSGYGGDPLSVLWNGLSTTLFIKIEFINIGLSIIFTVLLLIFMPSQIGIGTICSPVIISLITFCFSNLSIGTKNIFLLLFGVVIMGIGIGIYTSTKLGRNPYDGIVFMIQEKIKLPLFITRLTCDFLLCFLGYILGASILLGTVTCVIITGPIMQKVYNQLNKKF